MESVGTIINIFEKKVAIRAVYEFSLTVLPAEGKFILFSTVSRWAVGPNQSPI
jgi:hypothetical protein